MKRNHHVLNWVTFILAVLSISSLVFISATIHVYKAQLFLEKGTLSFEGMVVFGCFVFVFLFMVVSFIWQIVRIRMLEQTSMGMAVLLVLGVLGLLLFIGEKVMIDEIGRDAKVGWETAGETVVLHLMLAVQLAYTAVILFLLSKGSEREKHRGKEYPLQEENVFTAAQIIGVVCGLIGLGVNFNFFLRPPQMKNLWILIPFYILILLPYGLVVLYWFWMRRKVPFFEWYDEKQWRDVALAGLITLLFSILGMAVLFLFKKALEFFWFPHYVFLILTVFSACTLYLFKSPES